MGLWFFGIRTYTKQAEKSVPTVGSQVSSPHIRTVEVEWTSMLPMIQPWTLLKYDAEYYITSLTEQKNLPKKWDIIIYEHSSNKNFLIKRVMVTDTDTIELSPQDWVMKVNDHPLKNSSGETYFFTAAELKLLGLYVSDKKLPKGAYFIFGDNVRESYDSRKFWAVSLPDFRGKVIDLTNNQNE
jgi:signal peptidase I